MCCRANAFKLHVHKGFCSDSHYPNRPSVFFPLAPLFIDFSCLTRFKAMCRSTAKFSAASPFRIRQSSSRNTTSSTQCREFSIPQCFLTASPKSLALHGKLERTALSPHAGCPDCLSVQEYSRPLCLLPRLQCFSGTPLRQ